jgi:ABC-type bacteriocin/lantibiotic exporter with double-glycine peptidase domain
MSHMHSIYEEEIRATASEKSIWTFGWSWVWRSLWLRKWELISALTLTVVVYAVGLVLPIFTQRAIDIITKDVAGRQLIWLAAGATAAIVVEAALTRLRQGLVMRLVGFLSRRISRKAFLHLMRMRIDQGMSPAGDILNRFQQADKIPGFVLQSAPQAVFDAGNAIVSVLLMLYYDAVIGITTLIVTAVCGIVLRSRLSPVRVLTENNFKMYGKRQALLAETVTGIITIKVLALEGHRYGRWTETTDNAISASQQVFDRMRRFQVNAHVVMHALSLLILVLGCYRILNNQLTFGELMALQLLAGRLVGPLVANSEIWRQYQEVRVALKELGRLMSGPHERAAIQPPVRQFKALGISTANLTLRYASMAQPALDNVSFVLPARGRFALVGRNGSGKSSLIRVLLGLQREFAGNVSIAGHDLRHYDPRSLRAQIGIVDQDTVLFSGSIRENVAAGIPDVDDYRIRSALAFAEALSFVESMPNGLETIVEENGRNLSGGQRQRLAIARAVVRDPPLVLLDEPTAFLDAEAAVALEKRLAAWGEDRLLILVTHHLAAARHTDGILVLDRGRLVGFGAHATLLDNCTPYAALWSDYSRSMEREPAAPRDLGRVEELHPE